MLETTHLLTCLMGFVVRWFKGKMPNMCNERLKQLLAEGKGKAEYI